MERTAKSMPSCMSPLPRTKDKVTGFELHFTSVPSAPPEDSMANVARTTHRTEELLASQSSFIQLPPSPAAVKTLRSEPSPSKSCSLAMSAERVLPKAKFFFSLASASLRNVFNRSWTDFSSARASRFCASSAMTAIKSAFASPNNFCASSFFSPSVRRNLACARRNRALTFFALSFKASEHDFAASSRIFWRSAWSTGKFEACLNCTSARFEKADSHNSIAACRCSSLCSDVGVYILLVNSRQYMIAW
mmetsp:Transcript_127041/g.367760  ORF Transcript_127041/g.367760 Transcript_127041/m.367760 type:complete len:249 (+) Transcript_127041:1386-2132(+)